jgi:hypothetical protein
LWSGKGLRLRVEGFGVMGNDIIISQFNSTNMNKVLSQGKGKLKTLPNELEHQHQEYAFSSEHEGDYIKVVSVASPTFATEELGSREEDEVNNKENKISVCLKEINFRENAGKGEGTDNEEKWRTMESLNAKLQEDNKLLGEKLSVCMKKL